MEERDITQLEADVEISKTELADYVVSVNNGPRTGELGIVYVVAKQALEAAKTGLGYTAQEERIMREYGIYDLTLPGFPAGRLNDKGKYFLAGLRANPLTEKAQAVFVAAYEWRFTATDSDTGQHSRLIKAVDAYDAVSTSDIPALEKHVEKTKTELADFILAKGLLFANQCTESGKLLTAYRIARDLLREAKAPPSKTELELLRHLAHVLQNDGRSANMDHNVAVALKAWEES